jgi:hypothetical protein
MIDSNKLAVTDSDENLSRQEKALQRRLNTLEKAGVTDERLAMVIDEGLNAMLVEEKLKDGQIERIEVPNHAVREKYLDKGMKARNWVDVNIKVDTTVDVTHRVVLSAEDRAHLLIVADRLKHMNQVLEMGSADGTVQDGEIVSIKTEVN